MYGAEADMLRLGGGSAASNRAGHSAPATPRMRSWAGGHATLLPQHQGMLLTIHGVTHAGSVQHSCRLAVPGGYAATILNAVPGSAAVAASLAASGPDTCFELQAQDLAEQFERFRARRAGRSSDCNALTLFVAGPDCFEHAVSFGKRLRAGTLTVVIATLDDAHWRVTLNAYFLGQA